MRCDSTPLGASGCAREPPTSIERLGKYWPRLAPYASAEARACAHDNRVVGLLRSARSTTSPMLSWPPAAGITGAGVVAFDRCTRSLTAGDGIQYSLGCGGAPGTPLIDGGRCGVQAPTRS